MTRIRHAATLLAAGLCLGPTAAASLLAAPSQPPQEATADGFPDGVGKGPLMNVCSHCHTAASVVHGLRTRQEWSDVVDQMARFGAEASDQEFDQILNYLVKFYSPIRVNRATAKELENTLDIPAAAAEAIVAFRQEKGAFAAIEDLKSVPGLEWSKVEARKARLVFTN